MRSWPSPACRQGLKVLKMCSQSCRCPHAALCAAQQWDSTVSPCLGLLGTSDDPLALPSPL